MPRGSHKGVLLFRPTRGKMRSREPISAVQLESKIFHGSTGRWEKKGINIVLCIVYTLFSHAYYCYCVG